MFNSDEHGLELNVPSWVDASLEAIRQRGVSVRLLDRPANLDASFDLFIELSAVGVTRLYSVMTKVRVQPSSLQVLHNTAGRHTLLLTPRITAGTADTCRNLGIEFADSIGNIFLNWGSLQIDIQGRKKPEKTHLENPEPGTKLKSFNSRGVSIVFTLLSRPQHPIPALRRVSENSGASLGTVQAVISELTDLGYLEKTSGNRMLQRTRDLFERWVNGYLLNLAPKLEIGRYHVKDVRERLQEDPTGLDFLWGGEAAVAKLDHHLLPSSLVIYTSTRPISTLSRWKAVRAQPKTGNLEVRRRFWMSDLSEPPFVPSPLIYADLLSSGDPRQLEAATRLRENDDLLRHLDRH